MNSGQLSEYFNSVNSPYSMSAMLVAGGRDTNNAAAAGVTGTPPSRRSVPSVGGRRSGSGEAEGEGVAISALLTSWFLLFLSQREWGSCERRGVILNLISHLGAPGWALKGWFPRLRAGEWNAVLGGEKSSQEKRAAGRAGAAAAASASVLLHLQLG